MNKLHVKVYHQSKLYTDDTGRFPTRARSGNQYVIVAYHSSNVILIEPFASRKDKHRISVYNIIMQRLKDRNLLVDLLILDNECSKENKATVKEKWGVTYQLVPPDLHRRNAAERVIRTFKAHFLAILAGVAIDFPPHLWDLLLPQTELRRSQRWCGKSIATPARIARKWALTVCIARSAAFLLCKSGGTSC